MPPKTKQQNWKCFPKAKPGKAASNRLDLHSNHKWNY